MKTLIISITASALFLFGGVLMAQEDKTEDQRIIVGNDGDGRVGVFVETRDSIPVSAKDTTIITTKNKKIYIVSEVSDIDIDKDSLGMDDCENSKASLTNWAGIDLGVNGFVTSDNDIDLGEDNEYLELEYARSRTFSINFWEHKARLIGDHVGLVTGAGLQYNSYRFANDYTLVSEKDTLVAFEDSTMSFRKNKLRTTWLNIPLLLEFNTSKDRDRSLHVAAGVVGGLRLGSTYVQKFSREGEDFKVKVKNGYQVAPYKLEAMVRFGFGPVNLFASYQLTELFEEGHGPELYPFTAGVTLVAF